MCAPGPCRACGGQRIISVLFIYLCVISVGCRLPRRAISPTWICFEGSLASSAYLRFLVRLPLGGVQTQGCWLTGQTHSCAPLIIPSSQEVATSYPLPSGYSISVHNGSLVDTSCFKLYCLEMALPLHQFLQGGFAIWCHLDWYLFTFRAKHSPVAIWVADRDRMCLPLSLSMCPWFPLKAYFILVYFQMLGTEPVVCIVGKCSPAELPPYPLFLFTVVSFLLCSFNFRTVGCL